MTHPLHALTWLHGFDKSWLRGDVVAAITPAAYLFPAGLGDASLTARHGGRLNANQEFLALARSVADVVDGLARRTRQNQLDHRTWRDGSANRGSDEIR